MEFEKVIASAGLRYYSGLQAMPGKDRQKIEVENTHKIGGSVALDEDLKKKFPHACRWDYAVGYGDSAAGTLYFIEIHPSNGEKTASEIRKKKEWLSHWLNNEGRPLESYGTKKRFCWVSSGGSLPPKNARVYRIAAIAGVEGPLPRLKLE